MSLVTPPHSAQECLRTSANGQKPNKIQGEREGGVISDRLAPHLWGGGAKNYMYNHAIVLQKMKFVDLPLTIL